MAKCYIYVCAGCDLLAQSERSDALTCSTACRVRAHRSGDMKQLRALAASAEVHPAAILQAAAVDRLRPDLGELIYAGERTFEDVQPAMNATFRELLARAVRNKAARPPQPEPEPLPAVARTEVSAGEGSR